MMPNLKRPSLSASSEKKKSQTLEVHLMLSNQNGKVPEGRQRRAQSLFLFLNIQRRTAPRRGGGQQETQGRLDAKLAQWSLLLQRTRHRSFSRLRQEPATIVEELPRKVMDLRVVPGPDQYPQPGSFLASKIPRSYEKLLDLARKDLLIEGLANPDRATSSSNRRGASCGP